MRPRVISASEQKRLRQLINSGELPYLQLQGKNSPFLVDRRDLDKFIDRHKIGFQ